LLTPYRAAKTAKTLLKSRSSSLRLYNSYGIVENRIGRNTSANRVFATAINMHTSIPDQQRKYVILLWRTWIWEALRGNDIGEAVRRLIAIGGDAAPFVDPATAESSSKYEISATAELRAGKWLAQGREGTLSTGEYHLAVLYAELLAVLAYFKNSKAIDDALVVFSDTSRLFAARNLTTSPAHEQLHQSRALLLTFHINHARVFSPTVIRECLFESISLFPNNSVFLSAYIKNEARFRIDDRVRSLMSDVVLKENQQSIVGWFLAISAEISRGLEFGGTVYAVRAALDRAAESTSGAHSIVLWTSYLLFEVSQQDFLRAKHVFFRGLKDLPWSKWFVMLAFEHLKGLTFEEMRSVWNVLGERELRVHVDIGDMLEDISARRTQTQYAKSK
jgi:hypothetical protein